MRTVLVAPLGMLLGFFIGEALAATAGMISFAAFGSIPSGPALWILRSLPVLSAIACAIAMTLRRKPR
jgi:Family of unknown function (DUF5957)